MTESRGGNEEEDKDSTVDAESRTQAPTPMTAAGLIIRTGTLWGEEGGGGDMCRQEQRLGPDKTKTTKETVGVDGGEAAGTLVRRGGCHALGGVGGAVLEAGDPASFDCLSTQTEDAGGGDKLDKCGESGRREEAGWVCEEERTRRPHAPQVAEPDDTMRLHGKLEQGEEEEDTGLK
jgi:hypothetical protein